MLSREETMHPNFYDCIKRSLIPLMHDDLAPILRGYTEEILAKSRKVPHQSKGERSAQRNGKGNSESQIASDATLSPETKQLVNVALADASEKDLIRELARRRAEKHRQKEKAHKAKDDEDMTGIPDPTGQVCTLNGGNGSIPCRELME